MNVIDVLNRIEDNGFEAYIVGGYVRDYLLGIETNDIDICTNARVKDLLKIFGRMVISSNEYGAVKLSSDNYRFEITNYRRDLKYNGNNDLKEGLANLDKHYDNLKKLGVYVVVCLNKYDTDTEEEIVSIRVAISFITVLRLSALSLKLTSISSIIVAVFSYLTPVSTNES